MYRYLKNLLKYGKVVILGGYVSPLSLWNQYQNPKKKKKVTIFSNPNYNGRFSKCKKAHAALKCVFILAQYIGQSATNDLFLNGCTRVLLPVTVMTVLTL